MKRRQQTVKDATANDLSPYYIRHAIVLALRGQGHTRPNPPVGAVIERDGKVVGEGWHKRCGGDHAEVAALKDAARRGESVKGATLYVTLEPCSRPGRVGACTDAIIAAGIGRVVYAVRDPNPTNRGRAKRVLSRAGIECIVPSRKTTLPREWDVSGGMEAVLEDARRLIAPFSKHVKTGLPYVTVKLAMSLDGKICDDYGDAKWVSSAGSRKSVGWVRSLVDAIMVGAETVRRDNPSLLSHNKRNDDLIRVIVSKSGKLPKTAQVFTDGAPNKTLVFRDARQALEELGRMGVMHVLCEGGLKLATSLADAGLVDDWIAVTAPIVIGSRHISDALRFKLIECGELFEDDRIGNYERAQQSVGCRTR